MKRLSLTLIAFAAQAAVISYPLKFFSTAKAARAADLDGDGQPEIAVSCEQANGEKSVSYLKNVKGKWEPHAIGMAKGFFFNAHRMASSVTASNYSTAMATSICSPARNATSTRCCGTKTRTDENHRN